MRKLALIIPVLNEERTISKVIEDFKSELSKLNLDTKIFVIDNGSKDMTKLKALISDAYVMEVNKRGKGNALRYAFKRIKADFYAIVDGDDTYFAEDIHKLLVPVISGNYDMSIGTRMKSFVKEEKAFLHEFGNILLSMIVRLFIRKKVKDLCSGYRVMKKQLINSLNLESEGFEIETELTVKALKKGFKIIEVPIHYKERPKGSKSKLRTLRDGFLIFRKLLKLNLS